jgi:hypothetical protein
MAAAASRTDRKESTEMNMAEAARMIDLLEEVAGHSCSDALHAGIAQVLLHLRPCIPADQIEAFDRYSAREDYAHFLERMQAGAELA